jgi:hypothetical protein
MQRGLKEEQAWRWATNGQDPWWNSGSRHMNLAFPKAYSLHVVTSLCVINSIVCKMVSDPSWYGNVCPLV